MPTTSSPPCGLAPTPGIPLVAQAVLHRELLHVHASLAHMVSLFLQVDLRRSLFPPSLLCRLLCGLPGFITLSTGCLHPQDHLLRALYLELV